MGGSITDTTILRKAIAIVFGMKSTTGIPFYFL